MGGARGGCKGRTVKDGVRGRGEGRGQWSCAAWGRWLLCMGGGGEGGGDNWIKIPFQSDRTLGVGYLH